MRPGADSCAGKPKRGCCRKTGITGGLSSNALPKAPASEWESQAERAVQVEAARRGQRRRGREVLRPVLERVAHRAQQQLVRAGLALLHRLDQGEGHRACRMKTQSITSASSIVRNTQAECSRSLPHQAITRPFQQHEWRRPPLGLQATHLRI